MESIKNNRNFQDLSQSELTEITGGVIWYVIGGIAIAMVREVIGDWDNFKAGLAGQPEIKSW